MHKVFYTQKDVDELQSRLESNYKAQVMDLERQIGDLKHNWTKPDEAFKMREQINRLHSEMANLKAQLEHQISKVSGLLVSVVKWKKEARNKKPLPPGNRVEQTLHWDDKRHYKRWKEVLHHHSDIPAEEVWAYAEDLAEQYGVELIEVDYRYGNWHAVFYQEL